MKNKLIALLLLILPLMSICGQEIDINSLLRSDNQDLIKSAVSGGLYVVESSYLVQDNEDGKQYGLDGKPYFNKFQYLGVAIDNGLILGKNAVRPWEGDETFATYKEKYTPVFYGMEIQSFSDTTRTLVDSSNLKDTIAVNDNYVLLSKTMDGFDINVSEGKQDGWIIYVSINKEGKPQIRCLKKSIEINDSIPSQEIKITQLISSNLGGIYVTPCAEKTGVITFKLCGLLSPSEDNQKFIFESIPANKFSDKSDKKEQKTVSKPDEHRLTPHHRERTRKDKKKK